MGAGDGVGVVLAIGAEYTVFELVVGTEVTDSVGTFAAVELVTVALPEGAADSVVTGVADSDGVGTCDVATGEVAILVGTGDGDNTVTTTVGAAVTVALVDGPTEAEAETEAETVAPSVGNGTLVATTVGTPSVVVTDVTVAVALPVELAGCDVDGEFEDELAGALVVGVAVESAVGTEVLVDGAVDALEVEALDDDVLDVGALVDEPGADVGEGVVALSDGSGTTDVGRCAAGMMTPTLAGTDGMATGPGTVCVGCG